MDVSCSEATLLEEASNGATTSTMLLVVGPLIEMSGSVSLRLVEAVLGDSARAREKRVDAVSSSSEDAVELMLACIIPTILGEPTIGELIGLLVKLRNVRRGMQQMTWKICQKNKFIHTFLMQYVIVICL